MSGRDHRDMVGGVLMIAFGAFVAYYSARYDMGTVRRMGPGMFPSLVGYSLCVVGVLIFVPALYRARIEPPPVEWRSLILILGSLGAFALTVDKTGIVPAIVLLTIGSTWADGRLRPLRVLILAAVLSGLAILVFRVFLSSPFTLFQWPF